MMPLGGAIIGSSIGVRGGLKFDTKYQIKSEGLGSNFGNLKLIKRPESKYFSWSLRKIEQELPGIRTEKIIYTKRTKAQADCLRSTFNKGIRGKFLKDLSNTPKKIKALKKAELSDEEIANIKMGKSPNNSKDKKWDVHHIKPLDDGGTNDFDLVLIKNEPYHKVITNYQNSTTGKMKSGDTIEIDCPMIKYKIYPPIPLEVIMSLNQKTLNRLEFLSSEGYFLPLGADDTKIAKFVAKCEKEFGVKPPADYLAFLQIHNGFCMDGGRLYSTKRLTINSVSNTTLDFVEINKLARNLDFMQDFFEIGSCNNYQYVFILMETTIKLEEKMDLMVCFRLCLMKPLNYFGNKL